MKSNKHKNTYKAAASDDLPGSLLDLLEQARTEGKRVVLSTGVFDILHKEHKNFLQKARAQGDVLVVGVESDKRVRQIKGSGRPINIEDKRRGALAKIGLADFVFILPDDFSKPEDHRNLIQKIRPNVLAVSSHTSHLDKKQQILEEFGGTVKIVHEHNPNVSTTLMIDRKER